MCYFFVRRTILNQMCSTLSVVMTYLVRTKEERVPPGSHLARARRGFVQRRVLAYACWMGTGIGVLRT